MRLFIAIKVPGELHEYCKTLQNQFLDIKKTKDFHITIQFLGDDIKNEKEIISELKKITFKPFEIDIGDVMPFGNLQNPKGIWIECKSRALNKLAANIRSTMSKLELEPDLPFKPHITLGRYKQTPKELPQKIKGELNKFKVNTFYLMESKFSSFGPKYNQIAIFPI